MSFFFFFPTVEFVFSLPVSPSPPHSIVSFRIIEGEVEKPCFPGWSNQLSNPQVLSVGGLSLSSVTN